MDPIFHLTREAHGVIPHCGIQYVIHSTREESVAQVVFLLVSRGLYLEPRTTRKHIRALREASTHKMPTQ